MEESSRNKETSDIQKWILIESWKAKAETNENWKSIITSRECENWKLKIEYQTV